MCANPVLQVCPVTSQNELLYPEINSRHYQLGSPFFLPFLVYYYRSSQASCNESCSGEKEGGGRFLLTLAIEPSLPPLQKTIASHPPLLRPPS